MDTPDRIDGPLRARQAPLAPAAPPLDFDDDVYTDAGPPPKKLSAQVVWRAFRRHWWQAMLLWAAGSAALMVLAYHGIKPSYEAVAQFSIEPGEQALFAKNIGLTDFNQYREGQATLVTSPVVLGNALAKKPELLRYPRLAGAIDPEAEIRHALRVQIVRNTNQIQVAMSAESAQEAADIVNAVAKAYLKFAEDTNFLETRRRIDKLEEVEKKSKDEVDAKFSALQLLRESIGDKKLLLTKEAKLSVDQYTEWQKQLLVIEVEKIAAEQKLDRLRNLRIEYARTMPPEELERAANDLFQADPRYARILDHYHESLSRLTEAKRKARNPVSDAACVRHQRAVHVDQTELADLRKRLWPTIRDRLSAGGDESADRVVREAETRLADLVAREAILKDKLKDTSLKNEASGSDALKFAYAERDLTRSESVLEQVQSTLKQLEFEAKGTIARAKLDYEARPSNRPFANHRVKAMAATPIAVWFAVFGLLALVELRAGRVADPDELSSRFRLTVLGVVPPLPPVRPAAGLPPGRGEDRAQRRLEAFVQSLDHLRVALCARPDPWGRDRHCVLITSACGSEGKTTLAAQLAERCVNAGLMTLLIDADLRNPTLSRMMDATDRGGLINVLRGDLTAEEAIAVVNDAGGFHFLAAGTPRMDPSRLLQGDRLGHLLAQARESFDMIIVDAPPVLPVPDALTIGRWTDGAVLAVRYDTSRFPLVERANRRLAHMGVPVIGAVVSGVRSTPVAYGDSYAYGYGGPPPVPSA